MSPDEVQLRVIQISRDVVALREAKLADPKGLLLDSASQILAWIAVEESPTR